MRIVTLHIESHYEPFDLDYVATLYLNNREVLVGPPATSEVSAEDDLEQLLIDRLGALLRSETP